MINLDLARYNALQRRFEAAAREHSALLLGGVETASPAMLSLAERLDLVATASDAPILLLGEPGTGKSALAARIHELKLTRRRVKGRLVQVNCATLRGGKPCLRFLASAAPQPEWRAANVPAFCARRMAVYCSLTGSTRWAPTSRPPCCR